MKSPNRKNDTIMMLTMILSLMAGGPLGVVVQAQQTATLPAPRISIYMICRNAELAEATRNQETQNQDGETTTTTTATIDWQEQLHDYYETVVLPFVDEDDTVTTTYQLSVTATESSCVAKDLLEIQVEAFGNITVPEEEHASVELASLVTSASLKEYFALVCDGNGGSNSDLIVWEATVEEEEEEDDQEHTSSTSMWTFESRVAERICDLTKEEANLTLGTIVGISIGVLICLCCLMGLAFSYCCCG